MGVKTRIVATINNGRQTIHDIVKEASKENDEYIIESSFVVPTHANCLKINVSWTVTYRVCLASYGVSACVFVIVCHSHFV